MYSIAIKRAAVGIAGLFLLAIVAVVGEDSSPNSPTVGSMAAQSVTPRDPSPV
ncbi:hypothetical protein [Streptomyces sp. NPDC002324]